MREATREKIGLEMTREDRDSVRVTNGVVGLGEGWR